MKKGAGPQTISQIYESYLRAFPDGISRKTIQRDILEMIEGGEIKQTQERPISLILIHKKNYTLEFEEVELLTIKSALDLLGPCQGVDMGVREKVIAKIERSL